MHDRLSKGQVSDRATQTSLPLSAEPAAWPSIFPSHAMLWCALIGAAVHLALWQISEPPALFSDLYKAYYPAAEVLWESGLQTSFPFTEVGAGGFVNLPVLGFLFVPLVPLGEDLAGWVYLGIGAAAAVAAFFTLRKCARPETNASAPLVLLFLLNGPLINCLREGNTTHFVLLLLIVALVFLQRGAEFAAGLLLGLCAVIKLPLLLYAAYFLFRRRWLVVAGGASTIGTAALSSIALFGLANNTNWFNCCIEPFLGGLIPAFNVQSVDGFAMRLITGTSKLASWDPIDPPAVYKIIRLLIFATILCTALWVAQRASWNEAGSSTSHAKRAREMLEYSLVITLALVISPISWSHYYLLLLLPWGLFFGGRLPLAADRLTRGLTWIAIILGSLPIVVLPLQADLLGETAARTLVSAHFFGGLAMLAALLRSLYVLGGPAPGDAHSSGAVA